MTVVYNVLLFLIIFFFGKIVGEAIGKVKSEKQREEEIERLKLSHRMEERKLRRRIAELEEEKEGGTRGDV